MKMRLIDFIVAVVVFPFMLLFYMNKVLYGFTHGYVKGLYRVLRGTL